MTTAGLVAEKLINRSVFRGFVSLILGALLMMACQHKTHTMEEMQEYNGPRVELTNTETLFTDSAVLKVRITGKKQIELQNGNLEYPEGIFAEFYSDGVTKTSVLTANFARFDVNQNLYLVKGNVEIVNLEENRKLNTEELYWNPNASYDDALEKNARLGGKSPSQDTLKKKTPEDPEKKEKMGLIYTTKLARIQSPTINLIGHHGLIARQDFTDYEFLKPEGSVVVK